MEKLNVWFNIDWFILLVDTACQIHDDRIYIILILVLSPVASYAIISRISNIQKHLQFPEFSKRLEQTSDTQCFHLN